MIFSPTVRQLLVRPRLISSVFTGIPRVSVRLKHGSASSNDLDDTDALLSKMGSSFESEALKELHRLTDLLTSEYPDLSVDLTSDGVLIAEHENRKTKVLKTIVVNKHAASRKIWYSSPVSAPMYFSPLLSKAKALTWIDPDTQIVLESILTKHAATLVGS